MITIIYNNIEELKKDVKNNFLKKRNSNLIINFNLDYPLLNIIANKIDASIIRVNNINSSDINCCKLYANNIKAGNITAYMIEASNIKYWAFCIAFENLKYKTIKGTRKNSIHKCLDNKTIKEI